MQQPVIMAARAPSYAAVRNTSSESRPGANGDDARGVEYMAYSTGAIRNSCSTSPEGWPLASQVHSLKRTWPS